MSNEEVKKPAKAEAASLATTPQETQQSSQQPSQPETTQPSQNVQEEKVAETTSEPTQAAKSATPKKSQPSQEQTTPTHTEKHQPQPSSPSKPAEVHKLHDGWALWVDKKKPRGTKATEYKDGLKNVGTFHSIEEFYQYWSYLKKPSELKDDINLYIFRQGLFPAWETFPKGGHWIIKVTKRNGLIDHLWEELTISTIGELFGTPEVVGIAINMRKHHDYLTIWNKDNQNSPVRFTMIGERLKAILNLHHSTTLEYKHFREAITDRSSTFKARQYMYVAQH